MKSRYDLLCIGLGPAGMAVTAMGASMGLKVCAVEKHKIGGECMNVGCIPSKALLRIASRRAACAQLDPAIFEGVAPVKVHSPFAAIRRSLGEIGGKKMRAMFDKAELIVGERAAFVDAHTVQVGERQIEARRIFICTGSRPHIPPIEGLQACDPLTNETLFDLDEIPRELVILGSGAIGVEMAQAFARLGSQVTMVMRSDRILKSSMPKAASELLQAALEREGVRLLPGRQLRGAEKVEGGSRLLLDDGTRLECSHILVALGREYDLSPLQLERAGVEYHVKRGIKVHPNLTTSCPHIYAVGDCNGYALFSHAAMHQGMVALINSLRPRFWQIDFRKFVAPSTLFIQPQAAQVGLSEQQLQERSIPYEKIELRYDSYGAAVAEGVAEGFIQVYANRWGRVFGAVIVGEGAGEMINEWALVVQKKIRLFSLLFLQHSFPTMGFLSKRIAESWMMQRMECRWLKKICCFLFRL